MKRKIMVLFALCWLMAIGGATYAVAYDPMIDVPLPRCWPVPDGGCPEAPQVCIGWVYVCQTWVWPFQFCWYQAVPVPCDTQQ